MRVQVLEQAWIRVVLTPVTKLSDKASGDKLARAYRRSAGLAPVHLTTQTDPQYSEEPSAPNYCSWRCQSGNGQSFNNANTGAEITMMKMLWYCCCCEQSWGRLVVRDQMQVQRDELAMTLQ